MFAKAIQKIEKAMFPIFLTEQVAPNQIKVAVVGTGFFINSDGGFVSVAHVFDNRTPQSKYVFWGYLPNNLQNPPLEITEVSRDDSNDIFFGQVQIKTPHFVSFSKKLAPIGRSVCIAGYPLATITNNSQGGLELGGVRRYFQPSFILDHSKLNSDNGQGLIRTHDGFLVRDIGLFGMSGGPVFDTNATILGIQGSVTAPRVSTNGIRQISVENAAVIRSNLILEFLKTRRVRLN